MLSTSLNFEYKNFCFFFFSQSVRSTSRQRICMTILLTDYIKHLFIYYFFKYIAISGPRTNDIICRNVEVRLGPIFSYSWSPKKNVR